MMKKLMVMVGAVALMVSGAWSGEVTATTVTAQQRYPWNGLVDITVTLTGASNDVAETRCAFAATNVATGAAVPITSVSQNGVDAGSGTTWTRRFIWNATNDVGEVKIADLALAVNAEVSLGGVQLWENGPYWAECNVGATKPEEYGYYFWWGDTVGYTAEGGTWTSGYYSGVAWVSSTGARMNNSPFNSSKSTCPTYGLDDSQLQSAGYIDSTGNLVAAYDAATAHLGAPWRMPTDAEMQALISNCTTAWITTNGVSGQLVKGKGDYSSKSIFLPGAGYGNYSFLRDWTDGYYWSSTPEIDSSFDACNLYFLFSGYFTRGYNCRRDYGQSVRPVRGFAK